MNFLSWSGDFKFLEPGQVLLIENTNGKTNHFIVFDKFIDSEADEWIFNAYELGESDLLLRIVLKGTSLSLKDKCIVFHVNPESSFMKSRDVVKISLSSNEELLNSFLKEIESQSEKENKDPKLVEKFGWRLSTIVKVLLLYKK